MKTTFFTFLNFFSILQLFQIANLQKFKLFSSCTFGNFQIFQKTVHKNSKAEYFIKIADKKFLFYNLKLKEINKKK